MVSALQHNPSWSSLQCSYISENLRERGCDRKDVVILIIPAMTQPTRQVPQRSEAYFSPQLRREMTQWNLGHSHLTKYKLTWVKKKKKVLHNLLQHMMSGWRIGSLDSKQAFVVGCCYEKWLDGVVNGGEAEQAAWFMRAAGCSEPVWRQFLLRTAGCTWDCWLYLQRRGPHLRQQGSNKCEVSQRHEET